MQHNVQRHFSVEMLHEAQPLPHFEVLTHIENTPAVSFCSMRTSPFIAD
jgi:hypothetical protein